MTKGGHFKLILFSSLALIIFAANIVFLFTQSIRLDESQSIWISTKSVEAILKYISEDIHVPLYSLILHFWMQIFGSSTVSSRFLSLLFFIATLPVLYLTSKEASNNKVAIFHICLFALSPFIMWYTTETRMYTLFAFVTGLNHLFFLRFFRSNTKSAKFGYFISTVLGLYTHYFFLLVIFSQGVFLLIRSIAQLISKNHFLKVANLPLKFAGLMAVSFIFFAPWIIYFLSSGSGANMQPLIPRPTAFNLIQTFSIFLFGFQSQTIQAILVSLWPITMIFVLLFFTQKRKNKGYDLDYFLLMTFLPIITAFVVSYFRPIFLSRYFILATPSLFFVLAWAFTNSRRISTFLTTSIIVLMFAFAVFQNLSSQTPVKESYKEAANYLEHAATPKDVIAVSAPFTTFPIEYEYKGFSKITTIPDWNRYVQGPIPEFSKEGMIKQIETYKKQYNRLFLVLSYDQGYEKDIKDYFDKNYQIVETEEFSPNIKVVVYKLRYD